jgi:hypothetical protein
MRTLKNYIAIYGKMCCHSILTALRFFQRDGVFCGEQGTD